MYRTKVMSLALIGGLALFASAAFAETSTLTFGLKAEQPTLRNPKAEDTFKVSLSDNGATGGVKTQFNLTCQAGRKGILLGFSRKDEACNVAGRGFVIKGTAERARVEYGGGFIVKSDGYTDGRNITAKYLPLGNVAGSQGSFGGSLILKPEVPSSAALAFGETLLKGLKDKAGLDGGTTVIDDRTDTIEFSNFTTPSSGWPQDQGCSWRGSAVYAYQTSGWYLQMEADCNGKKYSFTGNMPWVDVVEGSTARYDITLTLPSDKVASNDALFADASNDALFAAADGISGSIDMKLGSPVEVDVEGKKEEVPSSVDATGTLTGQNVPIEVVRSFATIIAVLSRTFFGA